MWSIFFVILTVIGLGLMALSTLRLRQYWQRVISPTATSRSARSLGPLEQAYRRQHSRSSLSPRTITADEAFWATDKTQVQRWAQENLQEPAGNWNAILSGALPLSDIVQLATASELSAQWRLYFLRSAYIRVGDIRHEAERSRDRTPIDSIAATIKRASTTKNKDVADWAIRAQQYLAENPRPAPTDSLFTWHHDKDSGTHADHDHDHDNSKQI